MSTVKQSLRKIEVTVKGVLPGVMFQRKIDEKSSKKKGNYPPQEEEAVQRAHWVMVGKKKQLCIPGIMFHRAFCIAAASFKWQGRKTLSKIVGSTISIEPDRIPLGTDKFYVYLASVRIPPRTGAMVEIGRPLLREWVVSFVIWMDDEMWRPEQLREIIEYAGKVVGIGADRPDLAGPHGKFTLEKFEVKGT